MLFRALFWIAVVSLFVPREPDLGLGRPNAHASLLESAGSWISSPQANLNCRDDAATCRASLSLVDSLQSITVRSLAQVKADIEEQERARRRGAPAD